MQSSFPHLGAVDTDHRHYMQPEAAAWLPAQQQQQQQAPAGFMHDTTHEHFYQSMLHQQQMPSYTLDAGFDQLSSMYMPQLSSYSDLVNHMTPANLTAMRARALLPALSIPEGPQHPHLLAIQGNESAGFSHSAPSSAAQPPDFSFSKQFEASVKPSASNKRHSIDSSFFGRASAKGRQRTAQACEKCRDRKTKCSGERPTCKRCADRGLECVWAPEIRIRGTQRLPQRSRRLGSGGSAAASPLAQATPISGSSSISPSPPPLELSGSVTAPALQTSFGDVAQSSKLSLGQSSDDSRPSTSSSSVVYSVNKGSDALEVMGMPIRPISSRDDCWETVNGAPAVTPGWEKAFNLYRQRGRASSISVAHLARDHKLHQQDPAPQTNYFDSAFNDMVSYSPTDSNRYSQMDYSKPFGMPGSMDIDTLPPMSSSTTGNFDEILNSFKWPSFVDNDFTDSPNDQYTFPESVSPLGQPEDSTSNMQKSDIVVAQPQPSTHDNALDQFFNIDAFAGQTF